MMEKEEQVLLSIKDLTIGFPDSGIDSVVDGITFDIEQGEMVGIVGESGSGKTMSALAIMDLLPAEASIRSGSIELEGVDLIKLKKEEYRKLKGKQMAMIFQEPMTSLNPVMKIGSQIDEMLLLHEKGMKTEQRKVITLKALKEAGLNDAENLYHRYPHELSGGMRQRVMIAMAMILQPKLLIADEPTTALDVTIQAQILELIKNLNREYGTSVILITHDLGVVQAVCSRAIVMQEGGIVEAGEVKKLFENPEKEYTRQLIAAMPGIKEKSTEVAKKVSTCETDSDQEKISRSQDKILTLNDLSVYYEEKGKKLFAGKTKKFVVNQVSLSVKTGEILGIVGESGSGKSTLAKAVVGLIHTRTGEITLKDNKPQMVFQDPYGSLNPVKKVGWILEEPLKLAGKRKREERIEKVLSILKQVGLKEDYAERYLSQLSGGQRQRVAIGAALIQDSRFIVLDEPVSALDVTVQAQILSLLKALQKEYDLTYLFISHDLKVISQICDRVCVMYQGRMVETALVDDLFHDPKHPYTRKLLKAVL